MRTSDVLRCLASIWTAKPPPLPAIRRTIDAHPAALCVELIALTAVRAGEARAARWDEIDMDGATLTIPASRTKVGREFTVPLSAGAFERTIVEG